MVNRDQQVVFGYLSDPDRIGQKKKNFFVEKGGENTNSQSIENHWAKMVELRVNKKRWEYSKKDETTVHGYFWYERENGERIIMEKYAS